jgi:chromosome segregation ATPase
MIEVDEVVKNFCFLTETALRELVDAANGQIQAANDRTIAAEKARDEIANEKGVIEGEYTSNKEELEKLQSQKGREEAAAQRIDDSIDAILHGLPGDPGHLYDRDKRIAAILDKTNASAQLVTGELIELKAAIIPELERLEGHEKRLLAIVENRGAKWLPNLIDEAVKGFCV